MIKKDDPIMGELDTLADFTCSKIRKLTTDVDGVHVCVTLMISTLLGLYHALVRYDGEELPEEKVIDDVIPYALSAFRHGMKVHREKEGK